MSAKAKLKYRNHPQKFDNPDPELQKQWEDLKEVLCDNEYMIRYKIMVGQPINFSTVCNILTTVHTDTSNIYSHLIAGIFFIIRSIGLEFRFALVNLLCALTFFMSVFYHTFRNYSRKLYDITLVLDVDGINIQIFAYLFTDTVSFFGDSQSEIMKKYLFFYSLLFVISIIAVPFILHYKIYWLRTFIFIIISFLCLPQIYHNYLINGCTDKLRHFISLRLIVFFWQGLGLIFRSSHIPERFLPHTIFQYIFHSHFWFHACGAIGSYFGCLSCQAYE